MKKLNKKKRTCITVREFADYFYCQDLRRGYVQRMRNRLLEAGFHPLGRKIDLKDLGKVITLFV